MNPTRLAIERSRVTFVLLAVCLILGIRSYLNLPQAEDPGFTIRFAMVITYWPGASPERVEQLITDKLEKVIEEIPELDAVTSQSRNGVSLISVGIDERYSDMRPIWDNLRRKVEKVAGDLPQGATKPIVDDEYGDVFGTVIALTGDGYSYAELKDVADGVRDELLLSDDVAKVEIYGAQAERVFIEYSNSHLAELGLSPEQLAGMLQARNIVNTGGKIHTQLETITLEPTGNYESVEQLQDTLIALPGNGELVRLQDIARVYRDYVDPPESKARSNGEPALCLAIAMREGGNIVRLGEEVRAKVKRLAAAYPHGVELRLVQVQGDVVERKVGEFVSNLVQAVSIVLIVMLLSLGIRTGLVVASLIPSAIIMAFIFMPLVGVSIDQMSLAALMIALGLLVDNAIVMSESIMVSMGEGLPAKEAAIASASELAIPLLVSSLTTAAAFLPIFLARSMVGEYTEALFKVVTITLLCSWVLSLTMTPLLCSLFLRVKRSTGGEGYASRFYRGYRGVLLSLLRRPIVSLLVVLVVFVASLFLMRLVPVIFFPKNDRATLTAEWILPTGTPLAATEKLIKEIDAFIEEELLVDSGDVARGDEGITDWVSFLGEGGPRFYLGFDPEQSNSGYAIMIINTTSNEVIESIVRRLETFRERVPGLKTSISPLSSGPPAGTPIELRLSGRDLARIYSHVDRVKEALRGMSGPTNITDDWGARSKKIVVEINEARAQRAGVSNTDIARSLQTVFSGIGVSEYREGTEVIPITLRSEQAKGVSLEQLESINVFSQASGRSVPVTQVADFVVAWQPSNIRRRNRLKTVTVEADLVPGVTVASITPELVEWLRKESASWPLGYSWELGGENEASEEANASILAQLPVAGLVILLLLVSQFNSIRRPLIILLTIPLGLIGVIVGLIVLRASFGFMTMLGVISLSGIVINNAIVLIDRIDLEIREKGLSPQRAIIESAQRRFRPIILTTFTTLGGMIPLYLGGGPLFESMAAAIMMGLIFATALTLGVVPVLYSLFFRVDFKGFKY